jgi:hypothetical protein
MRKATENYGLIKDTNETFIGIAMGHAYCAEHEWGIKEIKNFLGIKRQLPALYEREMQSFFYRRKMWRNTGWTSKLITKEVPLYTGKINDRAGNPWFYLYITSGYYNIYHRQDTIITRVHQAFHEGSNPDVSTAWDEKELCIWFKDEALLLELSKAFLDKNIIITSIKDSKVFNMDSGYAILIANKVPESFKDQIDEEDKKTVKLQKEAWATGIYKKIPKEMYMALSPAYDRDTGKLIFWLNPHEQSKYNSGWYTSEQLLEWLEGKGPIPFKNKFHPGDQHMTYIGKQYLKCTIEKIISDTSAKVTYIDPRTKKQKMTNVLLRHL